MRTRVFGCRKFRRLLSDTCDRDLDQPEVRFMEKHRDVCYPCRSAENQSNLALNMLRESALDAQTAPMFEARLLRRLRLQGVRAGFNYWSPAFFGAAIAGVAILAAMQMITNSASLPSLPLNGNEARRIDREGPRFPAISFSSANDRIR